MTPLGPIHILPPTRWGGVGVGARSSNGVGSGALVTESFDFPPVRTTAVARPAGVGFLELLQGRSKGLLP